MAEHLWTYPAARAAFAEAELVLGWDIGELCRHGSMDDLTRTDRTQLAILACSVATWRVLEDRGASFEVAMGHSLGEYSALVASGFMTFADALRVVEVRGRGMQACAEERGGAMTAIIGLEGDAVEQICSSVGDVWLANHNSPGQVVISGASGAVRKAGEIAQVAGAKRVVPLQVSGAFHTPLMAGAADALENALSRVEFKQPKARFFSTTELRYPGLDDLAGVLARQLTSPVRFTESMQALLAGPSAPDEGLEVGPGAVLTGLVKRIERAFTVSSTGDADALERVLDRMKRPGGLP